MKCPGQDSRYWKDGAIFETKCPKCGTIVEFFKDDPSRKCHQCGHRFVNPNMDFGCASYCQFAEQCIGTLPPEVVAQRGNLLKDQVALEMKRYFKSDFKRIDHAIRVARYAEKIGKEKGGNLSVILPASYLHDIGIHESERKYKNTDKHEKEGIEVAKSILLKLGVKDKIIEEILDIIGNHHNAKHSDSINFQVVYEADLLVNLEDKQNMKG
ncbi:MAG: HD domain-containing protein [Desulfobacterales bacterium]|nr:HD domain-containing protein [Desulfobacterales bacterium]MBF0398958.1 HD domain-containing protein [Desulfobacterales bacterium]